MNKSLPHPFLQHRTSDAANQPVPNQGKKVPRLQHVTRPQDFDAGAHKDVPVFLLFLPGSIRTFEKVREYVRLMEVKPAYPRFWSDLQHHSDFRDYTHDVPFFTLAKEGDASDALLIKEVAHDELPSSERMYDGAVPDGFAVACINPGFKFPRNQADW